MQLRHLKTIQNRSESLNKITAISWSSNNQKIAVVSTDRIVQLYDESGTKQDRFSTKPGGAQAAGADGSAPQQPSANPNSYKVIGLEFSPCSTRLAIAQSDNIVFVYKIGDEWRGKKSICNKFPQTSSIMGLAWPNKHQHQLVFGLADGKVKVGQLKPNKAALLYSAESMVTCLSSGPDGNSVISGHLDGSIFRFHFETETSGPIAQRFGRLPNSIPVTAIGWGSAGICACSSSDKCIRFWTNEGRENRTFDYSSGGGGGSGGNKDSSDSLVRDFSCCRFNPSGESVVIGSYSKFLVFAYHSRNREWQEASIKSIPNLYTVSTLGWRSDGSRLLMGTLCGSVELWDSCIKRLRYRNSYEFTYISLSQVIVKSLSSGSRIVLRSNVGLEIKKINIYRERYLVAYTPESLLLGDLITCKLSEIPWQSNASDHIQSSSGPGADNTTNAASKTKFLFDNPNVCMIFRSGELSIVAYGSNEVLGWARTESCSPNLLSCQVGPSTSEMIDTLQAQALASGQSQQPLNIDPIQLPPPTRVIAYLLDAQTIKLLNLTNNTTLATVSHDSKIDWLELNPIGNSSITLNSLAQYQAQNYNSQGAGSAAASKPDDSTSWHRILYKDRQRKLHLYNVATQTRTTLLESVSFVSWVPDSQVVVAQSRNQLCVWYSIHNAPDRVTLHEIRPDAIVEEVIREPSTVPGQQQGRTVVSVDEGVSTVEYELDEALIEFTGYLERKNYGRAVDILEELPLTSETEAMWRSLAKVALNDYTALPVVEQCYAVLGDVSKSRYISKVNEIIIANSTNPEDFSQFHTGCNHFLVSAKMAMLSKQFARAEAILLENNRLEEAMSLFQELHRYDESIRLAEKKSHPNVLQLKNHYLQWLLSTSQYEKAAEILASESNYIRAIELYLQGGMSARAASVVQRYSNINYPVELLQRIASNLESAGLPEKAGLLHERLGDLDSAMKAYISGSAFRQAVELAKTSNPALVVSLEERWGDWLVSQKSVDSAINHYIEAGCSSKAIEAAISARQWGRAEQLLESTSISGSGNNNDQNIVQFYEKLAVFHSNSRQWDQAERGFLKANNPQKAIQMHVSNNNFDKASRVAKNHLSNKDRIMLYQELAKKAESTGRANEAEQLYLAIDDVDSAINLYKKREEYDQLLRLVSKYKSKDDLTSTYKIIAESYQKKGNLKRAEQYYIEAKLWTQAVSMYRQVDRWDDACRVAKSNGGKQAFEKVLLAQASSLLKEPVGGGSGGGGSGGPASGSTGSGAVYGPEAGASLLAKHGLYDTAIDFAVQHNRYEFAFELAKQYNLTEKEKDIHLKRAIAYEDEGNFQQAEESFLLANKPREVVEMHLHRRDFLSAMRVAENYDKNSKGDVLKAQATDIVNQIDIEIGNNGGNTNGLTAQSAQLEQQFRTAESLFIQAKLAESAVQMYSQRNMMNDAIRVSKKHCPHVLGDLVDKSSNVTNLNQNNSMNNIMNTTTSSVGSTGSGGGPGHGGRNNNNQNQNNLNNQNVSTAEFDELLERSKLLEETGNSMRALECLLQISDKVFGPPGGTVLQIQNNVEQYKLKLEETWIQAVQLSAKIHNNDNTQSYREKHIQVCQEIAQRLVNIQRFEAAGQLLVELDQARHAVEAFVQANNFRRAYQIAERSCPEMLPIVERLKREKELSDANNDGDEIIRKTGDVASALDMYARSGEWQKCLGLAAKQGNAQLLGHYVLQHIKLLSQSGNFEEACRILIRYGPAGGNNSNQQQIRSIYVLIAQNLINSVVNQNNSEGVNVNIASNVDMVVSKRIELVRNMLFSVVLGSKNKDIKDSNSNDNNANINQIPSLQSLSKRLHDAQSMNDDQEVTLLKLTIASHFCYQRDLNSSISSQLKSRTSESVLRYLHVLPMDRTFYYAGLDAKASGEEGSAFVYLNRYLDIIDAISDEFATVENGPEFEKSGLPLPSELTLPQETTFNEEISEEIRELVLSWSVSSSVKAELSLKSCDNCGRQHYRGSLSCPDCGYMSASCIITGQPVVKSQKTECSNCGSWANKNDWQQYIAKYGSCSWCGVRATRYEVR